MLPTLGRINFDFLRTHFVGRQYFLLSPFQFSLEHWAILVKVRETVEQKKSVYDVCVGRNGKRKEIPKQQSQITKQGRLYTELTAKMCAIRVGLGFFPCFPSLTRSIYSFRSPLRNQRKKWRKTFPNLLCSQMAEKRDLPKMCSLLMTFLSTGESHWPIKWTKRWRVLLFIFTSTFNDCFLTNSKILR